MNSQPTKDKSPHRLAVIASHQIQYRAPWLRALAAHPQIDLTLLFCSDWGLKTYHDNGLGREFKWDIALLDGYRSEFLRNLRPVPDPSTFWRLNNPSLMQRIHKERFDALLGEWI